MEGSNKKGAPVWWTNVIRDLERAAMAARKSYAEPRTVISVIRDNDDNILGYIIKTNTSVAYYSMAEVNRVLPIGSKIKNLPEPKVKDAHEEYVATLENYAYEIISDNVKLVPKLWLRFTLNKILNNKPVTVKKDFTKFNEWVLISKENKKDTRLIDILYKVTQYEGLKGLARFNDFCIKIEK